MEYEECAMTKLCCKPSESPMMAVAKSADDYGCGINTSKSTHTDGAGGI
jgi:hypothetical protein